MKYSKYFVSLIYMLMPLTAMAQTNNAVNRDFGTNQMHVVTNDNDVKYYNTKDVKEVKINGNKITVSANGAASDDIFGGNSSEVGFSLKTRPAASGVFANEAGEVEIAEARGWQESLYVEWKPLDGADSYNVYVKGGQYSDYTRIDRELVRNYGSYARADVLGLKAGSGYSVKVVPVADGKEIAEAANEATDLNVMNYSREGFAHLNYSGIGAYNDDGTLKSNAKVLYITAKTAKTVTTTVMVDKTLKEVTGLQSIIDA